MAKASCECSLTQRLFLWGLGLSAWLITVYYLPRPFCQELEHGNSEVLRDGGEGGEFIHAFNFIFYMLGDSFPN
jgi:hypothetical protein